MLNISKTITISGYSEIDGVQVAYMSASLNTPNFSDCSINKNIMNREAYEANKTQVRQDMADFEDKVFEEQDKLHTESVVILKKK